MKWSVFFKNLACVFFATLMIVNPAFAISDTMLDKYANNNIMFYEPCDDSGTRTCTAKPNGSKITWIGDSYTEGAKMNGLIDKKLPGVDIHSKSSKVFNEGTSDNPGGLKILKELVDSKKVRQYVVMALGTNMDTYSKSSATEELDKMLTVGGSNRTYVLMKPFTKNSADGKADYSFFNQAVDDFAKAHSNILVADWEKVARDKVNDYYSSSDPIHPSKGKGYEAFIDVFYNALPGGCTGGKLEGKNNAEKIWNWFIDSNISGIFDNPAVIAGIIGNMMLEAGGHTYNIDPFIYNGIAHYGIYQEDNADFRAYVEAAAGGKYWHRIGENSTAPAEAYDAAIKAELEYLTTKEAYFTPYFVNMLDMVDKDIPESYAELYMMGVEGAIIGDGQIEDSGVRAAERKKYGFNYSSWQGPAGRRKNARTFYDEYVTNGGSSSSSNSTSNTVSKYQSKPSTLLADRPSTIISMGDVSLAAETSNKFTWEDGWLTDGVPGIEKEDVTGEPLGETLKPAYTTSDGKPNKILLHNTEGTSNGFAAYGGNKFPAHFIVDLRKKQGYQNLPINKPALSTVGADSSTVQIEIVGWVWKSKPDNDYDLSNFTANDWDYLAVILAAIAQETGISLTTSLKWSGNDIRYTGTVEDFRDNVKGIVGHMHSPKDDHTDPGDIWGAVEEAIKRNPDASKFGGTSTVKTTSCNGEKDGYGANGLISGGMTQEQAEAFIKLYHDESLKERTGSQTVDGANVDDGGCDHGTLNNCSAFTQWFLNRYTTLGPNGAVLRQGSQAAKDNAAYVEGIEWGGKVPRVYAVFSTGPYSESAVDKFGKRWWNHTGIVLGIDKDKDQLIIGEASCSYSYQPHIEVKSLSTWTNYPDDLGPRYAYTDKILKGI